MDLATAISRDNLGHIDRLLWRDTPTTDRTLLLDNVGKAISTWLEGELGTEFRPIIVGTGVDFEEVIVPIVENLPVNVGCFWPVPAWDRRGGPPLIYIPQEYWEREQSPDESYSHALVVQPIADSRELLNTIIQRVLELAPSAKILVLAPAMETRLFNEMSNVLGEENIWAAQTFDISDEAIDYWELIQIFNSGPRRVMPRMSPWLAERTKNGPALQTGNSLDF